MLDGLLKYLIYGNHFCGVEYTTDNGKDLFIASVLKKSKSQLEEDVFLKESAIPDLASAIPKQQHICLVINTEKVLAKTVESEQQDYLKLVFKAFPNIDIDNFYYEVLSQGKIHYVALCRKGYVDELLRQFVDQKLNIVNFSLGHNITGVLNDFMANLTVYSSNSKIEFGDNVIKRIDRHKPEAERYEINGLKVSNDYLLSFTAAIESVLNNTLTNANFNSKKEQLVDDFKQIRFFNQFIKFAGAFILVLLLVNFFFFNHYFSSVNKLQEVSELNQTTKNQIIELDESVAKKKKMIDDILKSNTSKSSLYNDRIIKTLPKSILLAEIQYQPLLKRISKEKPIELIEDIILVSGKSNDSEVFSDWISQLEKLKWISAIDIVDYGSESINVSDFKIKIAITNE